MEILLFLKTKIYQSKSTLRLFYYLNNKILGKIYMASAYNYTFGNLSRIGDDVTANSERNVQNTRYGSYSTQNFFESDCTMSKSIDMATNQPNVFYGAGGGDTTMGGIAGCGVDVDSRLRIGGIQTNVVGRLNLKPRQFLSVPYLGKGPVKVDVESKMLHSGYTGDKKWCKDLMEKSFDNHKVDLLPSLQATVQNPANLVEGVAAEGWIRGGMPSRELARDNEYFKKN
jgi:hypothetical protein